MKTRQLGETGIEVGEIGLGAWQIGSGAWGPVDESEALSMIDRALDLGCNFIDTAPGYGGGRSEEVLGRALRSRREQAALCTKFGHTADGDSDFSVERMRPALEDSLRRLQTDHVDIFLLHNPPADLLNGSKAPHYAEMERLRDEGKIRAFGVSVDWRPELQTVLDTTPSTAVEVLFNAFHQDPLPAFRQAAAQGVGLIVKVPLDSGWLSGKYDAASSFDGVRSRWTPEQIERRAALVRMFRDLLPEGVSVRDAALQYILAQPEVSTVIPGARSTAQVEENCRASDERLPEHVVKSIFELWKCELESAPLPW